MVSLGSAWNQCPTVSQPLDISLKEKLQHNNLITVHCIWETIMMNGNNICRELLFVALALVLWKAVRLNLSMCNLMWYSTFTINNDSKDISWDTLWDLGELEQQTTVTTCAAESRCRLLRVHLFYCYSQVLINFWNGMFLSGTVMSPPESFSFNTE